MKITKKNTAKKKGGYVNDKEPLAATELFVDINNNTIKISECIDNIVESVLRNKVNKEDNVNSVPRFKFQIINKENDNLITEEPNKRSPTFSYNTYVPDLPFRYKHKASFSFEIPQYNPILIEKLIAKECSILTHNEIMMKITKLIKKQFVSYIRCKTFSQISENRSKFIFLYKKHLIYIQLDLYTYRNIYIDISMDIYYVKQNTWTAFFNAHIKNLYSRDDKWNILYDYEHEKLRFEALHRLEKLSNPFSKPTTSSSNKTAKSSRRTSKSATQYTLQSMPIELIDMQFDFLYNDHITEAAVFDIIQT